MTGDERLRLFLGLQIPEDTLSTIQAWQARELSGRIVPRENLHITMAFLGARPAADLPAVLRILGDAANAVAPPLLELVRYRETRSVGMLVLSDSTGSSDRLAVRLHEELAALGVYRPERRPWLPHVTVLRFREPPRLSPPLPELPEFAPSGAAAFLSRLHPSGARYEVLESFPLGG
ncbi:MAG TPA: 2'-5' RNA ligase family protein [Gaiellaceae bacterium]|nr:2'-5' RNA ligase family protein [Gaiellaceae bacterium]